MNLVNNTISKSESRWCLFITTAYLVLFPVYLWRSGLPQIADILFAVLAMVPLTIMFLRVREIKSYDLNLFMFAGLTFVINLIHYIFYPDSYFLAMSLVYLYNVVLFIFIRHTLINYSKDLTLYFIYIFAFILLAQIAYILFLPISGDDVRRLSGSFNNPNQLALWGISLYCIALIFMPQSKDNKLHYIIFALASVVVFFSLSRVGLVLLIFLWGVTCIRLMQVRPGVFMMIGLLVFSMIIVYLLFHFSVDSAALENYRQFIDYRFSKQQDIVGEIVSRGYERVFKYPYWLLIGAGEGGYDRFATGLEIHSGFVSIAFSYGIIGLILFVNILFPLARRANRLELAVLITLIGFNIVHQSIRFSMFWVVLAFIAAAQHQRYQQRLGPPNFSYGYHSSIRAV